MTDIEKRVQRLETALERVLDMIGRMDGSSTRTERELIKQYVRGQLEPRETKSDSAHIDRVLDWP